MTAVTEWTADGPEPPFGVRLTLTNPEGDRVVWTGKRWYDPALADGSLQTQEAWPPDTGMYGGGPWREVHGRG